MTPEKGVDLQVLMEGEVGMTPLLDEEVSFFLVFILLSLLLLRDLEDDDDDARHLMLTLYCRNSLSTPHPSPKTTSRAP